MLVRIDSWAPTWELLAADRLARARGEEPAMMPVVDEDPTAPSALPTADSYEFFTAYEGSSWRNEVTLRTLELFQGYEPGEYIKLISPTPLLMVVAPNDRLVAGEAACAAFETAAHPKKLVLVPGGHFDAYVGRGFEISSGAARDWFVEHLLTAAAVASEAAQAGAPPAARLRERVSRRRRPCARRPARSSSGSARSGCAGRPACSGRRARTGAASGGARCTTARSCSTGAPAPA